MAATRAKQGRLRKYLRRAAYGLGGFIGLVVLGVFFLLVSLRFAKVRGFVVARVNSALAGSFKGRITLHRVQSLGLGGVGAADAEVFDPAGRRVLDIHGLDVRLSLPTIAWAALTHGSKSLTIRLDVVALQHAEVLLADDGTGSPTLADAFLPKTPSPPSTGPGTNIILDRVELRHIWAHGSLSSTPPLDVELKAALGSLRLDANETAIVFKHAGIQARGLPQGVDPVGELAASLNIPAAPAKPLGARAHYQGSAAGIPVVLDGSYVDSKIIADVQAARIPPEAVAKQIPGLELRSPASLEAHAEGQMPALHGTFALGVGSGTINGDFDLLLKDDLTAKANVRAHDVDAAELSRAAPASNLDFTFHTSVLVPKTGPMSGNFDLVTEPSVISAQSVPAISLTGNFSNNAQTQRARVEAHAEIAEPGAQTSLDATVERSKRTSVEFKTSTELKNPPRLKQMAAARVTGELHAQGSYQVEEQRLAADVRADLRDISQAANQVAHAKLDARVSGILPHPDADVRLDVTDANVAGQHLADAQLAVRGSLSRVALSAEIETLVPERHIQISSIVSNDRGIALDHPSLNLSQGDTNLRLSAKGVQVFGGRTTVDNLHLEGAGTADASLVYGSSLESATVETYKLDLARLWRLVDAKAPLHSGTATLSVRYDQQAHTPRAKLNLRAENLVINRISGGELDADLTLENGRLDGTASANLKQMGHQSFEFDELRGIDLGNLNPARMSGKLAVEGQLELRDLGELVPKDSDLPIARARGAVKYDVSIQRIEPGTGLPTLHAHISTKNLQLAGARRSKTNLTTKQQALDAAPTSIKGLDVDFDLKHAETGETELAASVSDEYGALGSLSIDGKAAPPLASAATELARDWRKIPLSVRLVVPPRGLQKLPVEVRPAGLSGVVSGQFAYDGTIDAPQLKIAGKIDRFRQNGVHNRSVDLEWQGGYAGTHGTFDGTARMAQQQVGKADLDFDTAVTAWLNQNGGAPPALEANAHIDLDGFPIALLPGTQTSQVDGALSGKIDLVHFGKSASLEAKLEAKPFKVGQTEFGRIETEILAKDGGAKASLRVEDRQGVTTAEAHSGLAWGAKFVPTVVMPAEAQLRAKAFRLAAVAPFLTSSFGELDGQLSGDLNAHFNGGAPALDGHVDLEKGVAQVASLGQRFDEMSGRVSLVPGQVKLEQFSAHATSGKLTVTGGANFNGLTLTGADAHVRITKRDAIAVSVAGTDIGDCWGAIDVNMQPGDAARSSKLGVNIPELHVHIPDTGSQDVQALDPAKEIRIGTEQRDGDFVTLPLQPLSDSEPAKNDRPMIVDLTLGNQIWIQRGDSTKVQLTGKTELTLGDPATMTGQINLRGGKLDVSGKQFEIESGTITFSGEPGNPTIVATARWDAPDDEQHRVYADYSGTVKKGKIVLRSEPPLTQDEVLSLLLLGSADGSIGGPSSGGSSTAATAVGAVGGAATQGLNKALSNISSLDVSTRVDTSTGSARPELVVQLSPKVSANITRALGAPAPGEPPDLTFLTFDFRILSRWSLSALVGDRGESGLDLIWRRRY
jgi:autotransporter translocation and assembly factor TamB